MITFSGIGFSYPENPNPALDGVHWSIPRGSVAALLGPNGAGKTTLLRLLCGRFLPQRGRILLPALWCDSHGNLSPHSYGILVENPGIYSRLSVREYLAFFAGFYRNGLDPKRLTYLTEALCIGNLHQRMGTLSLGTRQKVQIVRAMLHTPPLVVLDEPTSNLDPLARTAVWDLVRDSQLCDGTTFIISSHQLAEMEEHCTHLAFLRQGRLLESGSLTQLRERMVEQQRVVLRYRGQQLESAWLDSLGIQRVEHRNGELVYYCKEPDLCNPCVIRACVNAGVEVCELRVHRPSLGELYRTLVQEAH